jgi:hypothetical protein
LKLKAKLESGTSDFNFKRLAPGPFTMDLIGSTCTALPRERNEELLLEVHVAEGRGEESHGKADHNLAAQVEIESII